MGVENLFTWTCITVCIAIYCVSGGDGFHLRPLVCWCPSVGTLAVGLSSDMHRRVAPRRRSLFFLLFFFFCQVLFLFLSLVYCCCLGHSTNQYREDSPYTSRHPIYGVDVQSIDLKPWLLRLFRIVKQSI